MTASLPLGQGVNLADSPYDIVKRFFTFPFELYPKQADTVNTLAPLQRAGLYAKTGTGKTAMGTCIALFKHILSGGQVIVTMPPILQLGWLRWLQRIPGVTAVAYRGTPKEREVIRLDAMFILMSIQIFKADFEYLSSAFEHRNVRLIVDEAHAVKNVASQNHRKVRDFSAGRDLLLMTATPITQPGDAYAYVKLLAPHVYRSQASFEAIHVGSRDFFGNVTGWQNLELMQKNMALNSVTLQKREVLPDLPEPVYTVIPYALDPKHQKLYDTLVEQQILELENGGKIDATSVAKLYNCCQQIVLNLAHFSGDPSARPAGFDVIDQALEECGITPGGSGGKLIISANYRMTIASLVNYLAAFGVVGINGTYTLKQKEQAKDRFQNDPFCQVAVVQPGSGGAGIDGWQEVCSDVLYAEEPITATLFEQMTGRVDRDGQKERPNVRLAVAENTIQVKLHRDLLRKDELAQYVAGGLKSLRSAIHGGAD